MNPLLGTAGCLRRSLWHPLAWLLVIATPVPAVAADLVICFDQAPWRPFIYIEAGQATGSHIELIRAALARLQIEADFRPMPWVRCLLEAEKGGVDAIATAAYTPQRAQFLHYPADAADTPHSAWRVGQIDNVIVSPRELPFEFNGDYATLPAPVRVPRGYGSGDFLREQGVMIDASAPSDESNLRKLLRDRRGVVIAIAESVDVLLERPEFAGRFHVSAVPVQAQSYFLPFSRAGARFDAVAIQRIWDEIARLREAKERQ